MKKLFIVLIILGFALGIFLIFNLWINNDSRNNPVEKPENVLSQKQEEPAANELLYKDQNLAYEWLKVEDQSKITLLPNFEEKLSSAEAKKSHACKYLVSGGFYTDKSSPIGLFIAEGREFQKQKTSSLLDGFFSINYLETPRITRTRPKDELRIAIQSGPLIIENSFTKPLSIKNDFKARRVLAITTGENQTIFLTVFQKDSKISGPNLADLPEVAKLIENKIGIQFADALNLDGGAASAYVGEALTLSEISPIGSYFCIQ